MQVLGLAFNDIIALYNEYSMRTIEFETDQKSPTKAKPIAHTAIERLILKTGLVKTRAGVQVVLIIITIVCVAVVVFLNRDQGSVGNSYGNYEEFKQQHPELFQ